MASDCSASAARASLASATVLARLALSLALASSMDWSFTNRLARAYFTCSASFSFPAGVQPSPASEARFDDSGSLCISRRRSCRRSIVSHCACSSRVEASYLLRSSASAPSVAMMAGGGVSRYGCPSRSCRNAFSTAFPSPSDLVDWKVSRCTIISAQKETYYVLIPRIEEHANSYNNTPIIDGSGLPESRSQFKSRSWVGERGASKIC